MLTIIPYKADHALTIQKNRCGEWIPAEDAVAWAVEREDHHAYTALLRGELFACGGINILWDRVGDAWVIGSRIVENYPLLFTRLVRRQLLTLSGVLDLERVQTMVKGDDEMALKWIELLGFAREGVHRKYYQGQTFVSYARVL